jgi:predicted DNA-binding protein (MmcQ/YjbR family)
MLREKYEGINPGHVPSTLLWNRVTLDSDVPDELITELIQHAVDEVVKKLPKVKQTEYYSI